VKQIGELARTIVKQLEGKMAWQDAYEQQVRANLKNALREMMLVHQQAKWSGRPDLMHDAIHNSLSNPATGAIGYMTFPAEKTWFVVMELIKEIVENH